MKTFVIFIGALIHWLLFLIIQLFGWVTAKFIFPIAWYCREWVYTTTNPISWFLYWYLDTLEPYGDKWYLKKKGLTLYDAKQLRGWKQFKHVYGWSAIRNPFWNFNYSIKLWNYKNEFQIGNGNILTSKGIVEKNGYVVNCFENMPVLKYVDEYGNYMNNAGDFLSVKYSVLGWAFNVWTWKGLPYFNFAFAGKWLGADKEIQIGMNHYRYTWRVKFYVFRNMEFWEEFAKYNVRLYKKE